MNRIQAVIFDMDGILIDSEPMWRIAELEVLHSYKIPLTEEMCIKMTGTRIDQLVRYYLTYYKRLDLNATVITNQIIDSLIGMINQQGVAMNGALEVLEFFRSEKLPLGLASSSSRRIIEAVLQRTGLQEFFLAVHSGEHEPYGKPHPAVYLTTSKTMQVDPYYCVAIEDSLNGIIAAKAARMKCIAIPEQRHLEDPRFRVSDQILPNLRAIIPNWQQTEKLFC